MASCGQIRISLNAANNGLSKMRILCNHGVVRQQINLKNYNLKQAKVKIILLL